MLGRNFFHMTWRKFVALAAFAFWVRSLFFICRYPPYDGFDEFMHVAYLQYLHEEGEPPVYGKSITPKSLYPDMIRYPHAEVSWRVIRDTGARSFRNFYGHTPELLNTPDISLYQGQHPPLYYRITDPLYQGLHSRFGMATSLGVLRALNAAFGACALFLLLAPLAGIFGESRIVRFSILAAVSWPMFLVNAIRVANDALAILFAAAAFYLVTQFRADKPRMLLVALAGLLLGLGAMTKLVAFLFLPAFVAYFIWLAATERGARLRWLLAVVALTAGYLVVAGSFHLASHEAFGTYFPQQETMLNASAMHSSSELLGMMKWSDPWTIFGQRLLLTAWTSGMTFMKQGAFAYWLTGGFFAACLVGWVAWFATSRRTLTRSLVHGSVLILLCVGAVFAAGYMHALHSRLQWNAVLTPSHYVMQAFPLLIVFAGFGLRGLPSRAGEVLMAASAAAFVVIEAHSWIAVAVPYWTQTRDPSLAWQRMDALTGAAGLSPIFLAIWTLLAWWLAVTAWRVNQRDDATRGG